MRRLYLLFIVIFLIGFWMRFYNLGEVPHGLHRDEAFLGYNAFSILKTGRDISYNFLPIHLESFLYSPAGYSYVSIPFISMFGLNAFSTRAASAFFGSATVAALFFLTKIIFKKSRYVRWYALLASFMLAISPWHINLSRTATENVVVTFFVVLGLLLFLSWVQYKQTKILIVALIVFGLSLLFYQAPRAFLPLFLPFLFLLYRSRFSKKNILISSALFLFLFIIPLVTLLSSPDHSLRIRTVSIFASEETKLILDEQIRNDGISNIPVIATRFFHNKFIGYAGQFLRNYFRHFTYDFYFTDNGFPDRYRIPLVGLSYPIELPVLLIGIVALFKVNRSVWAVLILWIILTPVGSALAFDDLPNLQRTVIMLPAISIILACGIIAVFDAAKKNRLRFYITSILLIGIYSYSVLLYLHQYYLHSQFYRPWYRHDGYKTLVSEVVNHIDKYDIVVVTNRESAPAIFFLFFLQYDPSLLHRETKYNNFRDIDSVRFGKFIFSEEQCPLSEKTINERTEIIGQKKILYVNSNLCPIPKGARYLSEIKRSDFSSVFTILFIPAGLSQ